MATEEAIGLFLEQDALLPSKILPHAATLAELVRAVAKAFKPGFAAPVPITRLGILPGFFIGIPYQ